MRTSLTRRMLVSSALTGMLWLLFAFVRWIFSQAQGPASQLARMLPEVVPSGLMWGESGVWLILTVIVGGLAVALLHALIAAVASRGGLRLVSAWFAAVAAGALVGLALDLATAWSPLVDYGPRGLLVVEFGAAAASGALWGLAIGWIPGLVARTAAPTASDAAQPMPLTRQPAWLLPVAAIVLVGVVAGGVAADAARTAAIEADAAAQNAAEQAVTFGAVPDPDAPGVAVPERANGSADQEPEWCTGEKATMLLGEQDAATGHRRLPIRLMNFSAEPCVIEGYPDVAFGDQNEHLLTVNVELGGSFMAQDPGPQRIEVPPGGYAVSVLGWDAASPHSALVTKTLHAAPAAGMSRGSWPIDLDIIEGSTVAVTAWAIDTDAAPSG